MSTTPSVAQHHAQAQHAATAKAATQPAPARTTAPSAQPVPQDTVSLSSAGAQASKGQAATPPAQDQNFPTYKAPGVR